MWISLRIALKNLFIKIGQMTKTDILYLARGNFWLGFNTVVGSIASLAIALAFGNFISKETYGIYRFILSFYSILALAGLGGFSSAAVRAVAKGFEGEIIRTFKIQFLSSVAGSIISFGIAAYYFLVGNNIIGVGFVILGLALPLIESLIIYEALLNGRKDFKVLSQYSIWSQLFAGAILLAGIFYGLSSAGLLAVYFGGWIAVRAFFFAYTRKKYRPNRLLSGETIKLGAHFTLMGVLNQIATYLDKIIIFHFLGAAEVAVYSFAIAPTEQLKGLFKNIGTLALPRFSERTESELKKTMLRKMLIMFAVVGSVIVVYITTAPFLFKLLLPKYTSSIFLSQIFSISLLGVLANLPVTAMKSLSKIKALYVYNAILPIINIVLLLTLIPVYGLMGAVAARTIIRISGVLLSIFTLSKS